MVLKQITWKNNNVGGKSAYLGSVKIGQYWYNGIDSKNGKYRVSCVLPQCGFDVKLADSDEAAKEVINIALDVFVSNITEQTKSIAIKVTNWDDFKDQFGTDFTSDRYKSSLEILKELTTKAFNNEGIVKQIAIEYERNNIDSGICLFEFKEMLNGVVMYDFTGTAK